MTMPTETESEPKRRPLMSFSKRSMNDKVLFNFESVFVNSDEAADFVSFFKIGSLGEPVEADIFVAVSEGKII